MSGSTDCGEFPGIVIMASLTRRLGAPLAATGLALAFGIIPAQAASASGWQRVYRNSARTGNILYSVAARAAAIVRRVWGHLWQHGSAPRVNTAPTGRPR